MAKFQIRVHSKLDDSKWTWYKQAAHTSQSVLQASGTEKAFILMNIHVIWTTSVKILFFRNENCLFMEKLISTTIQATFVKYYRKLKWILEIKLDNTCKIISPIFSLAIPVPRIEPRKSPWEHGSNPKFPVILDEKATNYDNIIERFK